MENKILKAALEGVLFVSGEPVSLVKLAKICEASQEAVRAALDEVSAEYAQRQGGLMVVCDGKSAQIATSSATAPYVEKLVTKELQEGLSQAALEVLSIVAYRGPVSKPQIEAIRGVNCSYTLRNLLLRGLIEKTTNPQDGRGYSYALSVELLKKLGIDRIEKMPEYAILSKDERLEQIIQSSDPA